MDREITLPETNDCFCNIPPFVRKYLLENIKTELDPCQFIQNSTIEGCRRPAIWFQVADTEPDDCMDAKFPYRPGRIFFDLEVHSDKLHIANRIAGEIAVALEAQSILAPDYDFDGCCGSFEISNQDEDYRIKAPGSKVGDYVVNLFVEMDLSDGQN